ncbi:hypothetical protein H4R19_005530 [Coemansia spiralis]|nr:hypothetical protein H4R19_005530 [Coemansia spiralis]
MAAVRERIVPLSVPNLLALGSLTILGIVAALVYVKTAAAFWLGPRSKWAGVSRASVAAELASALIYALQTHAILRNTVYLWCLVRYSRFAVSTVVEFSTALRRTQGPAPAPAAPGSQGQVERSIAARKQVDREAWWWLSRAVAPLVLVVYVAAAPFLLRSKVWSAEGAGSLIAFYMRVLYTLHIVPQIVLNARLRSGALMPAIVPLCYSIFRILFALGSSVSDGYLNKSELIEEGIGHIGAAVFVAQRAWYRKPKMD